MPRLDPHKLVAIYEGGKAVGMVVIGLGCLSLVHRDVHEVAVRSLELLRFNPASHYPRLFLQATTGLTDGWLRVLGGAMLADAVLRFAEAWGLWNQRRWAEWLAVISGSLYFPFEIYELARGFTGLKFSVLLFNIVIVAYMGWALYRRPRVHPA
ncbi:MAG TPA: DUF2127 domain-containing protein [Planctomycetaceae bacterium]|nr:DUF2127 domain-containing protein [Planctomycetaceae bacterium]